MYFRGSSKLTGKEKPKATKEFTKKYVKRPVVKPMRKFNSGNKTYFRYKEDAEAILNKLRAEGNYYAVIVRNSKGIAIRYWLKGPYYKTDGPYYFEEKEK